MAKIILFSFVGILLATSAVAQFESNIYFITFASDGTVFNSTFDDSTTLLNKCQIDGNMTLIIHGWKESINSVWTNDLINNFLKTRTGCVMFMDYNFYSKNPDFGALVLQFSDIQKVVTKKLQQFSTLGYNLDNILIFGFSYGAHLAFEGAYNFGPRKIGRLDICDPAGPYFTDPTKIHAVDAAKQVQCLHTSSDYGTTLRYCPKDILLGNCGLSQVAATVPPRLSHGLCPFIYTSAFNNDFKLVTKNAVYQKTYYVCSLDATKPEPDVTKFAKPAVMGIKMDMTLPDGQYYALTSNAFPYNVL